jgi:hypothetical protein
MRGMRRRERLSLRGDLSGMVGVVSPFSWENLACVSVVVQERGRFHLCGIALIIRGPSRLLAFATVAGEAIAFAPVFVERGTRLRHAALSADFQGYRHGIHH